MKSDTVRHLAEGRGNGSIDGGWWRAAEKAAAVAGNLAHLHIKLEDKYLNKPIEGRVDSQHMGDAFHGPSASP